MVDVPVPRSYPEILGEQIRTFLARSGVSATGLAPGNPILSLLSAASASDFRAAAQILQQLASQTLESAQGQGLDREGLRDGVPRLREVSAYGDVTISDERFQRIATRVNFGFPAVLPGSTSIYLAPEGNFADWPATGTVYLARGTSAAEAIPYTAIADIGGAWVLTVSGIQNPHPQGTEVVLGQGGVRTVPAGATVRTTGDPAQAISYVTVFPATLLDGEVTVSGILVRARRPGPGSNVPARALSLFSTPPFVGAAVQNPRPIVTGRGRETDEDYKARIRRARATKEGTRLAIEQALVGLSDPDGGSTISSVTGRREIDGTYVVSVDDGTGQDHRVEGVAFESIVSSAQGGEYRFRLQNVPMAKARVVSNAGPFSLVAGQTLVVDVGGVESQYTFSELDATDLAAADAFEISQALNGAPDFLAQARVLEGRVVLTARSEENDEIRVLPGDAQAALGLSLNQAQTLWLYRDDVLLSKDGDEAAYEGRPSGEWAALVSPQTLTLSVDGTGAVTYTFTDTDFAETSGSLASASVEEWVRAMEARLPGIEPRAELGRVVLVSRRGRDGQASVVVSGGSLVTNRMFDAGSATGKDSDYTLFRPVSEVVLSTPLVAGQKLSAGTAWSRAFLEADLSDPVTIASEARWWVAVDGGASPKQIQIPPTTTLTTTMVQTTPRGMIVRLTASAGTPFTTALPDDIVIIEDSTAPASLSGPRRVVAATGSTIDLEVGMMDSPRVGHTATLLADGRILIVGGELQPQGGVPDVDPFKFQTINQYAALSSVEIYDPADGTFVPASPLPGSRAWHSAHLLSDGKVAVVGGRRRLDGDVERHAWQSIDEVVLYDPALDTWTLQAAALPVPLSGHAATTVGDIIVITGGFTDEWEGPPSLYRSEYNGTAVPAWTTSPTDSHCEAYGSALVPISATHVALLGGINGGALTDVDVYNLTANTWAAGASMDEPRAYFVAAFAAAYSAILVAGGEDEVGGTTNTVEELAVAGNTVTGTTPLPDMEEKRSRFAGVFEGGSDTFSVWGGIASVRPGEELEFGALAWTEVTPSFVPNQNRKFATATLLPSNNVVVIGGVDVLPSAPVPLAHAEVYEISSGSYSAAPSAALPAPFSLTENGISLLTVDSKSDVDLVSVPAGTNITPNILANDAAGDAAGVEVLPYRTTRARLQTQTYGEDGEIYIASENLSAAAFGFDNGPVAGNPSQVASTATGLQGEGTPEPGGQRLFVHDGDVLLPGSPALADSLRGRYVPPARLIRTYPALGAGASARNLVAWTEGFTDYGDAVGVQLRDQVQDRIQGGDRATVVHGLGVGPGDTLQLQIDESEAGSYTLDMGFGVRSLESVYGVVGEFQDLNGNSLLQSFGSGFDFSDMALFMRARTLMDSGSASLRCLWSWKHFGAAGERVRVAYANPVGPNEPAQIQTFSFDNDAPVGEPDDALVSALIHLPGGVAKTVAGIRASARIRWESRLVGDQIEVTGFIGFPVSSAQRAANVTTLTLDLTTDVSSVSTHQLGIGQQVWVDSSHPSFGAGLKTITGVTATTLTYADPGADAGPIAAPGMSVSADTAGSATFAGATPAAIAVGTFLKLSTSANLPSRLRGQVLMVRGVGARWVRMHRYNVLSDISVELVNTTQTWTPLLANTLTFFEVGAGNTVANLAAIDHPALVGRVAGTGLGTVTASAFDTADSREAWSYLRDGINWVRSAQVVGPEFELTLKLPTSPNLATNSLWTTDEAYLVPQNHEQLLRYLAAPGVAALDRVADLALSRAGQSLQIASLTPGATGQVSVTGGSAQALGAAIESAGIESGDVGAIDVSPAAGVRLWAGDWVQAANQLPSAVPNTFISAATALTSWAADGTLIVTGATPYTTILVGGAPFTFDQSVRLHRHSPTLMAIFGPDMSLVRPGDWIRIGAAASNSIPASGQGIFRVAMVGDDFCYYFDEGGEDASGNAKVGALTATSLVPGQVLLVTSEVWGPANVGQWVIEDVGVGYTNNTRIRVRLDRAVSPVSSIPALGAASGDILILDQVPPRVIAQIHSVVPGEETYRLILGHARGLGRISPSAGASLTALDRLGFGADTGEGSDAYSIAVGVVGIAAKAAYGTQDSLTWPGVVGAGAEVLLETPRVRRVRQTWAIRLSDVVPGEARERFAAAIAAAINRAPGGQPLAIAELVAAGQQLRGIVSAVPVSPTLTSSSDQIPCQSGEKLMVLDPTRDITVLVLGE